MSTLITISDLIIPMTRAEATASIYSLLETLGVPTGSWKSGGVLRTMVAVMAAILAVVTTTISDLAKSAFRSTSTGNWLTLVAREVYACERIGATFATGEVTFTNLGGGVFTYAAGELIVACTKNGVQYRNVSSCTIAAATTTTVDMIAMEAGADASAMATEIDTIVTTMVGGVTCSNAAALIGTDEESDDQLRVRADARLDSLSPNGAANAYVYTAMTATRLADGTSIGVNRVTTTVDSSTATVTVYVADADGAVSGSTATPDTDLYDVNYAIQNTCVPLGVTATVESAVEHEMDPEYTIYVSSSYGYDADKEVTDLVDAGLATYCSTYPIGGQSSDSSLKYVYTTEVAAVIRDSVPGCIRVKLGYPATDIELDINEVIVPGDITCLAVVFV